MPIFQKKTQDGRKTPQKAPPKALTPALGTGGRRSLSMVGKALADVVNNRKSNHTPPKPSARALAKVFESSSDAYDSSTAVESSPPNQPTPSSPARRSGSISSTKVTPPKRDRNPISRPSSKGTGRGTPVLTREDVPREGTSLPTTSKAPSSPGASFRRVGHVSSASVASAFGPEGSRRSSRSIEVKPRNGPVLASPPTKLITRAPHSTSATPSVVATPSLSPHPLPIATAEDRDLSSPTESVPGLTRASSIKVASVSALPQPKTRPRSSVFASMPQLGEPRENLRPKLAVSLASPKKTRSVEDDGDQKSVTGLPIRVAGSIKSAIKDNQNEHRQPSPTASVRSLIKRPLSPLPKCVIGNPPTAEGGAHDSGKANEPSNTNSIVVKNSKSSVSDSNSTTAKRRSGLPRPSSSGAMVSYPTWERAQGISMKGAASRRTATEGDPSDGFRGTFKKRKSDIRVVDSRSNSRQSNNVAASPRRTAVRTSHPRSPAHQPKTPSTSKVPPRFEQTFSIPRNRLMNFSFADMTLPSDDTADFDGPSLENFTPDHHNPSISPLSNSVSLPTIFLPPSRPYQPPGPLRTTSRATRRGRPSTAPVNSPTSRPSILSFDAIAERSREFSEGDMDTMLSEVPAPFTPDVHRSSLLLTTPGSSELSFNLDDADAQTASVPPSPLDRSFYTHSQKSGATGSISQLLFPASTIPSEMPSPSPVFAAMPHSVRLFTEQEIIELRVKVAAHETASKAQEAQVANLEAEIATAYSVTRSRESACRLSMRKLASELAQSYTDSTKETWNYVAEFAKIEHASLAAERSTLQVLVLALDAKMPTV
ncbi:uncharacterized protein EI90DRAFT_3284932 [Cantharellus anzutake]|uniref:uncharacterized protein n=1 Tax=Cantharellus anzutake TaxID=1750568 RepID=UPI00190482E0|nr:uncharacterized protein EI90DRAFT_3284932 [Cantharellus anzutake]KAF8342837.1 hypothetical protein EI90DRAFT_3284932 [Cantharellus anzutake]